MGKGIPGEGGLIGITVATLVTCAAISMQTGTLLPWIVCGGGLIVGWWAVEAINEE